MGFDALDSVKSVGSGGLSVVVKREREIEAWLDCEVDVNGETIELGLLVLARPARK